MRREQETSEVEGSLGQPCKCFFALTHLVSIGILPNVNSVSLNRDVNSVQSAYFRTGRLKNNPKKAEKGDGICAVAIVKRVRQLSCVSQDTEPPESAASFWKGLKVLGPI